MIILVKNIESKIFFVSIPINSIRYELGADKNDLSIAGSDLGADTYVNIPFHSSSIQIPFSPLMSFLRYFHILQKFRINFFAFFVDL